MDVTNPKSIMGMFSGIATSASGTNQSALGIYQLLRARKVKKDNYVPESLQQNIAEAEALSSKNKYVGQESDEANVRKNTANAISQAREGTNSSANLLNFVSGAQSKQNQAMNQIGQKAMQFQQVNRQNAQNLRGQRANIEMDNMRRFWAAKSALKGAGIQNLMQGQASIHQGAGQFLDSFMGGGMMGGAGGGLGNLASSAGGAAQNNPQMMSPQAPQYNPIYQANPQYNQYPTGLYS